MICMDWNKKKMNEDFGDEEERCGFCGCPVGAVDRWDDAAMAGEEALQDAFEQRVIERVLALVEELQDAFYQARKAGWAAEAACRGTGTDGEA